MYKRDKKNSGCVVKKNRSAKERIFICTCACAYACTHGSAKRQKNTIDKNGFLSVISDKKYPSCIRLKIFNEKAK